MTATTLKKAPISGSLPECNFGVLGGDGAWVLFEDGEGSQWAGVFPGGRAEVASFGRSALVIARGEAHLVDVVLRSLSYRWNEEFLQTCIAAEPWGMYVAASSQQLFAFSPSGFEWRSPRVAFDGVVFRSLSGSTLLGAVWEIEGWYEFALSLPQFVFQRGRLLGRAGQPNPWSDA